jgi:2-polyprenyl-3-methyl-5-hydroxy-6-metoxy-1,4-benzoquinol methylase
VQGFSSDMYATQTIQRAVDKEGSAASGGPACPACGQSVTRPALEEFHRSWLHACSGCDLHFWHPVSMPDADWHERAYQGRDQTAMPLEPGHRFFLSDPKAPKRGRLLDLGCGVGNFLAAARDSGFDATGIEMNRNAVRFAQEHYGLRSVSAMRPQQFRAEHANEKFDVVTFFEVLEHQEDPQGFLNIAKDCLAEDGYLALSVPNRNRWQKGTETLDYPPNHLTRWSPRALERFLTRNGFEILTMREEPLGIHRAAQVLSAGLPTHLVSHIAGERPPTLAALAEMEPETMEQAIARVTNSRGHRLATHLVRMKTLALVPVASALLPYLRFRGRTGLYLYCLAQQTRWPTRGSCGSGAGA